MRAITRRLQIMFALVALASLPMLSTSAAAQAIVGGLRPRGASPNDEVKARLVGLLTYTRLNVHFDDAPARDVFRSLGAALGVTLIGRYSDDKTGEGIDPDMPITIHADGRFALDVLEEMLEQCEAYEDCTWQVRVGMLEVGTKRRLAVPAAAERRVYEITDLLFAPTNFKSPGSDPMEYLPCTSPYVDAVLGEGSRAALISGSPPSKSKTDRILELVEGMVEMIEPGHWDLDGDRDAPPIADEATNTPADKAAKRKRPKLVRNPELWASVQSYREALIIVAPDFIHRQINGYPPPIKPADASTIQDVPLLAPPVRRDPAPAPVSTEPAGDSRD